MDHIYAPPNNARMTFKRNLRLGDDDILLWPQPLLERSCHFAAIPRQPEDLTITHRLYICFYIITDADFVCNEIGPVSGLGNLNRKILQLANQFSTYLDELHDIHKADSSFPTKVPTYASLHVVIKRSLIHLGSLPMTQREMCFIFAEMQRLMLEFLALHDFLYIYRPRMLGEKPPATKVGYTIGSFVSSVADSESFLLAGLPVWLIRPAKLAGTVRVDKLVELAVPKDFLCLDDNFDQYPVEYCGPPTNPEKYITFGRYARSLLSYSNPFITEPTNHSPPPIPSQITSQSQPSSSKRGPTHVGELPTHTSKRSGPCMSHTTVFAIPTSHKTLDPQTKPNTKTSNASRNKYTNMISPLSPSPIETWRDALQCVDTNPARRVSDVRLPNSGYAFPEPGLFLGVTSTEKQARFFFNWLKYRPALLYRLTAASGPKPVSNQLWRTLLSLPSEPALQPQTSSTKSAANHNIVYTLLDEASKTAGLQLNATTPVTIHWHQHQIDVKQLPPPKVAQEILWELHELNFRCEFLALDHHAHDPIQTNSSYLREEMVLACFPHGGDATILVTDVSLATRGLAAEDWRERAPYIIAMRTVLQSWMGFPHVAATLIEKEIDAFEEQEIMMMETTLTRFYTQTFFNFFGRAAILPRRLTGRF